MANTLMRTQLCHSKILRASFGQHSVIKSFTNETLWNFEIYRQSLFCKHLSNKHISKTGAENVPLPANIHVKFCGIIIFAYICVPKILIEDCQAIE
ncbi:MAG: hypothetical protein A2X16_09560 [Bacteroidetes bacterium GWF2_39_10]|nr:MAG: hypothetical protein A2X16_09560 [Bacteroidetes bacterium GWF2_39_10]OFZ09666.1 MAG: hypothetical protein A2465_00060 [Bacteroidetes bacterium RIFOXYC2_FULL_39_11]HCT94528.1 hypothetical protein [Rikenellaceae bacterium]